MPGSTMIRKQLYITREQERALKERARAEGRAEAEISERPWTATSSMRAARSSPSTDTRWSRTL